MKRLVLDHIYAICGVFNLSLLALLRYKMSGTCLAGYSRYTPSLHTCPTRLALVASRELYTTCVAV